MLFLHRKGHPAEVTLLVFKFEQHPGASVLHEFQPPAAVGLLVAVFHPLTRDHVRHLALKQGSRGIAPQRGVALAGLNDRAPKHIQKEHNADHQPDGAPAAAELRLVVDQERDHSTDGGDHQALQHLLGVAEGKAELIAGGNGGDQPLQFTGAEGNEHGVAFRSGAQGRTQGCRGCPPCAP